mgnify:CR=1 FL=1
MAKGPTITTIASGYYSRTALNDNFTNIDTAFENTLSLDGSTPNAMGADLDLNNNDILNAGVVNATEVTVAGIPLASNVAAAAASATSASLSAAAAAQSVDEARLIAFGAVGDGITDDTAAVVAAVNSGLPLQWDDLTYRITSPLIATVSKLDWTGNGAVIFYDGAHAQAAVNITCALSADHTIHGITFDANSLANIGAKFVAATVAEAIGLWPNFYASSIIARNAYRADLAFSGGDGLSIHGGFNHAEVDNIRVHDCYMAVGAEVVAVEGIFGLSFLSNGSRRCRNVRVTNYHIENVWSEDAAYLADQDAVRIFQEPAERTSTCFVLNGTVKNVSNRAIKLHSAVNAVVDGLYRELSSTVIPQSGAFGNPDIDSQQCPSTITNCRFHYDGAWHSSLIQNYTERTEEYSYGGTVTSGISGRFVNVGGSTIVGVVASSEAAVNIEHRTTISDIAIDGPLSYFAQIVMAGTSGSSAVTIANASAEITAGAVLSSSTGTGRLRVTAANLHNTASGSPVPLGVNFATGDRELSVVGYYGFTEVGAEFVLGGDAKSGVFSSLSASTTLTGPNPNVGRVGDTRVGYDITSDAGASDTDTILLLQPSADTQSHTSGTVQLYRGASSSWGAGTVELSIRRDAGSGTGAAHCIYSGHATKAVSLITCVFGGVTRIGVRFNGGGIGLAFARAFFNGNYRGTVEMRLVPSSSVTSIAAFVQQATYEPSSAFLQPVRLPSYTVATLPTAGNFTSCLIWVTDEVGGSTMATSDGTNWRRMSNGAIVS